MYIPGKDGCEPQVKQLQRQGLCPRLCPVMSVLGSGQQLARAIMFVLEVAK
jgi:hypothetical protein